MRLYSWIYRRELRDEHRRLRRQPLSARRLVHRPGERVPLRLRPPTLRTKLRKHPRPLHAEPMSSRRAVRGGGVVRGVHVPVPGRVDGRAVRARRGRVRGDGALPQRGDLHQHGGLVRVPLRQGIRGQGLRHQHGRLRVIPVSERSDMSGQHRRLQLCLCQRLRGQALRGGHRRVPVETLHERRHL